MGLEEQPGKGRILDDPQSLHYSPEVDLMSYQAVREYIAHQWARYQEASRILRSLILDEVCGTLALHRKSAIRLMSKRTVPKMRRGRGPSCNAYTDNARKALKQLWQEMAYPGAVRMKGAIKDWLPHWQNPDLDDYAYFELGMMSASTIERSLKGDKSGLRRRLNTGTRRGSSKLKTVIPLRDLEFEPKEPGHCEIDCVAHCGGSLSGDFIWTLTVTDILTGHTECEALQTKNGFAVTLALRQIEDRLPFPIIAIYSDNGSEFINDDVFKRFANHKDRAVPIGFHRSRPYKKNDQCYVEQKNYTHVREIFGYDRLTGKLMTQLMNAVYRKDWRLLANHFLPQIRLKSKERVGSKIIRRFKPAQTPYTLLCRYLKGERLERLQAEHKALNPFDLRHKLKKKLRDFQAYNSRPRDDLGKYAI